MVLLSLNSWLPQYSWYMDLFTLLSMMNLIIGVSVMKTGTAQNITALSLLAFVLIALPVQALAADHDAVLDVVALNDRNGGDHNAQAQYYKHQADVLQTKVEDQINALRHKPRSSFLGRNGQHIKKHVEFKIHQYEMAIADNLKKAEYHQKMTAGQSIRPASVHTGRTKS